MTISAGTLDVVGFDVSVTGTMDNLSTLRRTGPAGQAVAQDNANDRASFDGDDVTWTGLDVGTPNYAIIYDSTHALDVLIGAWEIATASNGGDYTLQWHGDGILLLT